MMDLSSRLILELRRRALRRGVWFRVLDRAERAILETWKFSKISFNEKTLIWAYFSETFMFSNVDVVELSRNFGVFAKRNEKLVLRDIRIFGMTKLFCSRYDLI